MQRLGQDAAVAPGPQDRPALPPRALSWIGLTLLALGLAVRCRQYLHGASYWYDEAYLLLNVYDRSYLQLLGAIDYQVVIPPFFLWLLRAVYLLLGPSELAMRLPAFASGVAALLVLIPLARRLVGTPGWLWAVGFGALSAHAVMHACEVRPYAGDLLAAECILLAAATWVLPEGTPHGRRWGLAGLYLLAGLAPWFSFPSAFVLGAASLALFVHACQHPTRARWLAWAGLNGILLASGFALWYCDARHLYYPGLTQHWSRGFFPPGTGPVGLGSWVLGRLAGIGHYGTAGLGVPLLALAGLGGAVVARRSVPLVLLLTVPVALGFGACFLHKYPMDDRLVFFAVPSVWLLASAGIGAILGKLPAPRGRAAWAGALAFGTLLLPGVVEAAKELVWVVPRVEFRGAFAYVGEHWRPGDTLWVMHSEVYETYFGKQQGLQGNHTPPALLEAAARQGRVWLIYTPPPTPEAMPEALFPRLEALGCVRHDQPAIKGLRIVLYEPGPH
jgi:hypothetical protein